MWIACLAVLTLIVGLLAGYYARDIQDKISRLYALHRERLETPAGVVKPIVTRGQTRAQVEPIDLSVDDDNEGGAVLRPTPQQVTLNELSLAEKSLAAAEQVRRKRVRQL